MYPGNGQQPPQQPPQNWGQQYQGFGMYNQQPPPEPPRKRPNLVMIFSIVAIVVIIGAVVAIVLLNRGDSTPTADSTTTPAPPPTGKSSGTLPTPGSKTAPPSGSGAPGDQLKPKNPGWTVIKNDDAHLIYEVPSTWKPDPSSSISEPALPGAKLSFVASANDYKCQNNGYSRGVLGGGTFPKSDPGQVGQKFAKAYGDDFYSSGKGTTSVGEPKKITDFAGPNGKVFSGVQVDAAITASGNECLATTGRVSVLVIDDGTDTYKVFLVNADIAGGPATPGPPLDSEVQKILDSARVY